MSHTRTTPPLQSDATLTMAYWRSQAASARQILLSLWKDRLAFAGALILFAILIISIVPHVFTRYKPSQVTLEEALLPPTYLASVERPHLLGTDHLGRDLWSRILHGAHISLFVAFAAVAISGAAGIVLGLLAGFFGRVLDNLIMGITEIQAAIPVILLALSIVAVLGPGVRNLIMVLALTGWVIYARTVRAITMSLREKEFVTAARAIGCDSARIMLRHILPQMVAPVIVVATLEIARMIILESALSFLGLGVQPPNLSWGLMLGEGNQYLLTAAWLSAFPGVAIAATVFSVNAVGDWLRGTLDPSMKRR